MEAYFIEKPEVGNENSFLRGTWYRDIQARRSEIEKSLLPAIAASLRVAQLYGANEGKGDVRQRINALQRYLQHTPLYAITEERMNRIVSLQ